MSADRYITTRVSIIPTLLGLTLLAKPCSDFPKQGNSRANICLKRRPDSASGTADSSTLSALSQNNSKEARKRVSTEAWNQRDELSDINERS